MTRIVGTQARTRRRMALALVVATALVGLSATVAYGALGGFDTATGTGALASEAGGDQNTADGYNALNANTVGNQNTAVGFGTLLNNVSGIGNTAVGAGAGTFTGLNPNQFGTSNTYLGVNAAPANNAQLSHATAIGADATVGESFSLVLGAAGTNVGVDNASPNSIFQVGTGATGQFAGAYIQIPVVTQSGTPPSGACDNPLLVGRMVLQAVKSKVKLWVCTPALAWKAV